MSKGLIPDKSNILNIEFKDLEADAGLFKLPYYKKNFDFKEYVNFIKGVEKLIRTSDEYKAYINYLKTEIKLNFCMVLGNVTDDEDVSIEMHHGPILTLFDICDIVANSILVEDKGVSSIQIANIVLQEHFNNNVQVVMLSKTAHQLIHTGELFISPKQAWGNINAFLEKYKLGLTKEHIDTINKIIEVSSEDRKSDDNDLLQTDTTIKSWNRNKEDNIIQLKQEKKKEAIKEEKEENIDFTTIESMLE